MTVNSKILSQFGITLDLAVEAQEIVRGQTGQEIPGVAMDKEKYSNCTVTTVRILEQSAEQVMGKPRGTYITIEAPGLRDNNREVHQEVVEVLAKHLGRLFNLSPEANVLVVGLGNWNATPDALGPKVVDQVMVTRHIFNYAPSEVREGMRPVSAVSPGVLGITGIETAEIIKGIVDNIKPELIIAIDSLASRSVERIATTIQIADTGIAPGSGVGNKRAGINKESMGVPTIAIGVPTVVHAAMIASDAIDRLFERYKTTPQIYQAYQQQVVQEALNEVLAPFGGNLMVTPKEVDMLIQNTSKIIAGGVSAALHSGISSEEFSMYLH
ncbi:spore protease [Desulfohalotomaculum tongense]|uniref:GPR endopeptidase n=1 Tax=Desulforadius tongensis TaxID=1216062 RepID=UPI001A9CA5DD|nr:GPR endopeptidase [Desulforadius tongensis]MBM7856194.1 spore protease [Desulforadius tongensis]